MAMASLLRTVDEAAAKLAPCHPSFAVPLGQKRSSGSLPPTARDALRHPSSRSKPCSCAYTLTLPAQATPCKRRTAHRQRANTPSTSRVDHGCAERTSRKSKQTCGTRWTCTNATALPHRPLTWRNTGKQLRARYIAHKGRSRGGTRRNNEGTMLQALSCSSSTSTPRHRSSLPRNSSMLGHAGMQNKFP